MSREESCGGGLGAVPGGPQKCAFAVTGRRPAFLATYRPDRVMLVSANGDDPKLVPLRLRRSWAILVRRCFSLQPRPEARA
jgi:hypothetical protein